ncbi:DUF2630 family protein [Planomonospora sp. ID91781]|uniref:DUF2630 domain-containing protein n=3 Tax=Planomonospora TaxID=1998 RepID=A0A161MAL8_9ACTN|nr:MULTISPECIES: DUF2630 family protein [Planomonospora]MBG0821655.1 DUF2630 family protein [Planomonospora sp. ID91781]GAT66763.1 hypothetical protein PS9374_02415 [Planomonospora sphaerica]GGK71577.1 hypothetical protein GCM10010126_33840 [Planomonospora parontospora]GII09177.1 hypothetical protein Ppa06_29750 [Planomonospora parontospora subsp. parontospora]
MKDVDILAHINHLIAEERDLRALLASGSISSHEENHRIRSIEEALDQAWDLLRQRRAHREFGEDPNAAEPRPVDEVEEYRQ